MCILNKLKFACKRKYIDSNPHNLKKFKMFNFRDIINDDNNEKRRGSARRRPKTPASVTWLYRSLRDECENLQEQYGIWKKHGEVKKSESLQVNNAEL